MTENQMELQWKKEFRMKLKKRRSDLALEYVRRTDRSICLQAVSLPEYREAGTVFCYVGTAEEINTRPILERILADGKCLGVPRCIGRGVMEVRKITDLSQLHPGRYGILEPEKDRPLVTPAQIDLAFVPCLSCSQDGVRLGYGGGYYDRYLAQTSCAKIALCREEMMEENLPAQRWDIRMDGVLTEKGYRRTTP